MHIEAAELEELKSLLHEMAHPDHPPRPGAALSELKMLETRLQCRLPDELRSWLATVDGAFVGGQGLLKAAKKSGPFSLEETFEFYPLWKENGWFPVASDGCGNSYVLLAKEEGHPVAFIDTMHDPSKPNYLVASSLVTFLGLFIASEAAGVGGAWMFDKSIALELDPALASRKGAPLPWEAD
jgi:cell wall assembly regulator SMI1